jgi:hypothetical protein
MRLKVPVETDIVFTLRFNTQLASGMQKNERGSVFDAKG